MTRLRGLNNKVFHEDSHSTRTQNGTSTNSRFYQDRRPRSQQSEPSRKEATLQRHLVIGCELTWRSIGNSNMN
uniref:Bm1044 n=1 Tax=Brugia malayi TaxID=6279 RepID=A0A0I9NAP7_BRUMA|nr:Bm1044 [Brugia malayi]